MAVVTMKRTRKKGKSSASAKSGGMRTAFHRSGERRFYGFVIDDDNPSEKFCVEILVDGVSVRLLRADAHVQELVNEKTGDGCYGFSCSLDAKIVHETAVVEARLANLGTTIGTPIEITQLSDRKPQLSGAGNVRWLGGLRFSGWIAGRNETATGNVLVDGTLITQVRASTWSHIGTSEENARAVRTFDFHLPERFADGIVHQLVVIDDAGKNIGGTTLIFIAYKDGLREAFARRGLSEQDNLRARLFDHLLPMSLPFSEYRSWRESFATLSNPSAMLRGAVIVIGQGPTKDTIESLNKQSHTQWIAASLPQTLEPTGLQIELVQEFLDGDGADCDFVTFALAGTIFVPSALQRIAATFVEFPAAQAIYTDLDFAADDGSVWPLAFPAFDYERLLEQGYCSYLFGLRRVAVERAIQAGAFNLYRLFNSVLDEGAATSANIVHLPGSMGTLPAFDKNAAGAALAAASIAHLQRRGIRAQATLRSSGALPAVQITRTFNPDRVTIIIPTRNRKNLLRDCIESIRPAVVRAKAQVLVVDNDSVDPDTLEYLAEIENHIATVLRVPGEFNFPRLNNYAVKAAKGEVLCLLNNDVEALDDHWLDEMLSRIAEDDVGAVGAQLVWPSGVVQHGGVVLGPNFAATHAFNDRIDGDIGYSDSLCVAHECSAVTAACLVTRRSDYLEVGGMDELAFPVNFNDVDYCLKLRALGKRIVFTPHAKLAHLEIGKPRT